MSKLLKMRGANLRPLEAGTTRFLERGLTWLWEKLLNHESGISPEIADRMFRDGLIKEPRMRRMLGRPNRRKFYPLEDVKAAALVYAVPTVERRAIRTPAQIATLPADELVNLAEAEAMGFSRRLLQRYTEFHPPHKNRKGPPAKAPPINRTIYGEQRRDSVSDHGQRVSSSWFRVGDLRDIRMAVDNPPVPPGGILVRDALPKLADEQIPISHSGLLNLIKDKVVTGGKVPAFKSNFAPYKMWWMTWGHRDKIPIYEKPGTRRYWINRKDFYPAKEAKVIAGVSGGKLWGWTPIERGGKGEPCPAIGRAIHCVMHPVRHRNGHELLVYAGDDLRIIEAAENGLTTPRPAPKLKATPTAPANLKANQEDSADSNGDGITVSAASKYSGIDQGQISRAAKTGKIANNGAERKLRRLDAQSFISWLTTRREKPETIASITERFAKHDDRD